MVTRLFSYKNRRLANLSSKLFRHPLKCDKIRLIILIKKRFIIDTRHRTTQIYDHH